MAHPDPKRRSQIASLAASTSWARTPVREERMRPANRKGPANLDFHLERLDPAITDPKQRILAAQAAKDAWWKDFSARGVATRRAKAAAKRAARSTAA